MAFFLPSPLLLNSTFVLSATIKNEKDVELNSTNLTLDYEGFEATTTRPFSCQAELSLFSLLLPHYSKSQIIVQKFNFDKIPIFSQVFHLKLF